jgi:hypothetical protein
VSSLQDVFYTRDGLAYTYDTLLVGKSKASANAWGASAVSYLAASLMVKDGMIAPLPDAVAACPERYLLEYLSKVFLLRDRSKMPSGEFWCARKNECGEVLRMFAWPNKEVPVISRDENHQTWCSTAVMWPYQDTPPQYVSKEEIGALRTALGLGGWVAKMNHRQLVIVVDDKWIRQELAEAIEEVVKETLSVKLVWTGRTSLEASLRALRGAWGVLCAKGDPLAAWCWVLPRRPWRW